MKRTTIIRGTFNSNNQSQGASAQARSLATGGRSLRFWQRMLGAAFLCLVLVGVALFRALPAPGPHADMSALTAISRATDHSLAHYLHSGQWRADLRTLASMVQYLVTPDSVTATNRPVLPA
jgi:hypothetical protein